MVNISIIIINDAIVDDGVRWNIVDNTTTGNLSKVLIKRIHLVIGTWE
jgi:hypothetical protein